MDDIISKFSQHLKSVLTRALCVVVETKSDEITPAHLLWALGTEQGCVASEILTKAGLRLEQVQGFSQEHDTAAGPAPASPLIPALSEASKTIIEKAVLTANLHEHRYIGTEHLLAGIIQVAPEAVAHFFDAHNINTRTVAQNLATVLRTTAAFPQFPERTDGGSALLSGLEPFPGDDVDLDEEEDDASKTPALDFFTRELTEPETARDTDPVIGRDREIERLVSILCRRTKNNPILVGEPGVGKTAIVEGLAKKIVDGSVPGVLEDKRIFRLDLASLIAGTMYRGEFESRLRQLIEEIATRPEVILFIDEVHTIMGAGAASGSLDAANILKPALARGDIRCIGATTPSEYKKFIEVDGALERRFQPIRVEEPTAQETRRILEGVSKYYEAHHGVVYAPEALDAAITLSKRYMTHLHFPDKAIDLLDEAGAAAAARRPKSKQPSLARLKRELEDVIVKKNHAVAKEQFMEAVEYKKREQALEATIEKTSAPPAPDPMTIGAAEIIRIVSRMTHIPETTLAETVVARLRHLERSLKRHVFGQDHAVRNVAALIRRASMGLGKPERPLASLLFTGPSGVGKTELAKSVARYVFDDPAALLRLDMSEYSAPFTTSKLIGAPAGYVGYREQSILTDHVKQRPHSVILFDEIEKAHTDIHHLLLQILDNGTLTDATGRPIDFRNTILILTSNVGSERFDLGPVGFASATDGTDVNNDVRKLLEDQFAKEFLNRIDHICVFSPLTPRVRQKIAQVRLAQIAQRMEQLGSTLSVDRDVLAWIAQAVNQKFGARDVHRHIEEHIERPLIDLLMKRGNITKVNVHVRDNAIHVFSS